MKKLKIAGLIITLLGLTLIVLISVAVSSEVEYSKGQLIVLSLLGSVGVTLGPAIYTLSLEDNRIKKVSRRGFWVSIVLFIAAGISIYFHLLGAGIELIFGILIFLFFYGTLAFKNKYEKWKQYTRSNQVAFFLSLFDFLGLTFLGLGVLFKIQHWPKADVLFFSGAIILSVGMFAWNHKFKKEVVFRKEAEDKLKELLTEIESQKDLVEEKQKEIIDSIVYAKRIQQSRMPSETYIEQTLNRLSKK